MDAVRVSKLHSWRECLGQCIVCGAPMGLDTARKVKKDNDDDSELLSEEKLRLLLEVQDQGTAVQENSVRVAMFRYNLLNKLELCHVIDKYTALRPVDDSPGKTFWQLLTDTECLQPLFGERLRADLEAKDAEGVRLYERAVRLCARVVDRITVPGCKNCNAAMNHWIAHSDIVYRCFPYTANTTTLAVLETTRDRRGGQHGALTTAQANKVKKWIQQVAFFFHPPTRKSAHWTLKTPAEVTLDAALYRTVANLWMWGKLGLPRFRMIAIFYGAWYVFHDRLVGETGLTFTRWHMHSFRDAYVRQYRASTWFGMKQADAAVLFDASRAEPTAWLGIVRERVQAFGAAALERALASAEDDKIEKLWESVYTHVTDERTLMHFACQKHGVDKGLRALFAFFIFNIQDPACALLQKRAEAFLQEVGHLIKAERQDVRRASR